MVHHFNHHVLVLRFIHLLDLLQRNTLSFASNFLLNSSLLVVQLIGRNIDLVAFDRFFAQANYFLSRVMSIELRLLLRISTLFRQKRLII